MMDQDNYTKPKHRKFEKHFPITINGNRVKILNYKISSLWDEYENQEYQVIELITKISNENLNYKKVNIIIESKNDILEIEGVLRVSSGQPGLSRHKFRIESYIEKNKK